MLPIVPPMWSLRGIWKLTCGSKRKVPVANESLEIFCEKNSLKHELYSLVESSQRSEN